MTTGSIRFDGMGTLNLSEEAINNGRSMDAVVNESKDLAFLSLGSMDGIEEPVNQLSITDFIGFIMRSIKNLADEGVDHSSFNNFFNNLYHVVTVLKKEHLSRKEIEIYIDNNFLPLLDGYFQSNLSTLDDGFQKQTSFIYSLIGVSSTLEGEKNLIFRTTKHKLMELILNGFYERLIRSIIDPKLELQYLQMLLKLAESLNCTETIEEITNEIEHVNGIISELKK